MQADRVGLQRVLKAILPGDVMTVMRIYWGDKNFDQERT